MTKNISILFLSITVFCVAVYIGVFIGRTTAEPMFQGANTKPYGTDDNISMIDLNTASVTELTQLPGITTDIAISIIKYREKYGQFYKVKEILDVDGVTEQLYQSIRSYVTIGN